MSSTAAPAPSASSTQSPAAPSSVALPSTGMGRPQYPRPTVPAPAPIQISHSALAELRSVPPALSTQASEGGFTAPPPKPAGPRNATALPAASVTGASTNGITMVQNPMSAVNLERARGGSAGSGAVDADAAVTAAALEPSSVTSVGSTRAPPVLDVPPTVDAYSSHADVARLAAESAAAQAAHDAALQEAARLAAAREAAQAAHGAAIRDASAAAAQRAALRAMHDAAVAATSQTTAAMRAVSAVSSPSHGTVSSTVAEPSLQAALSPSFAMTNKHTPGSSSSSLSLSSSSPRGRAESPTTRLRRPPPAASARSRDPSTPPPQRPPPALSPEEIALRRVAAALASPQSEPPPALPFSDALSPVWGSAAGEARESAEAVSSVAAVDPVPGGGGGAGDGNGDGDYTAAGNTDDARLADAEERALAAEMRATAAENQAASAVAALLASTERASADAVQASALLTATRAAAAELSGALAAARAALEARPAADTQRFIELETRAATAEAALDAARARADAAERSAAATREWAAMAARAAAKDAEDARQEARARAADADASAKLATRARAVAVSERARADGAESALGAALRAGGGAAAGSASAGGGGGRRGARGTASDAVYDDLSSPSASSPFSASAHAPSHAHFTDDDELDDNARLPFAPLSSASARSTYTRAAVSTIARSAAGEVDALAAATGLTAKAISRALHLPTSWGGGAAHEALSLLRTLRAEGGLPPSSAFAAHGWGGGLDTYLGGVPCLCSAAAAAAKGGSESSNAVRSDAIARWARVARQQAEARSPERIRSQSQPLDIFGGDGDDDDLTVGFDERRPRVRAL